MMKMSYNPFVLMFVAMMVFHLFVMPPIMIQSMEHFYLSLNQVYMGLIMSLYMVLIEAFMHPLSPTYIMIILVVIILLVVAMKRQWGIDANQYLRDMIPHHSMALQTSQWKLDNKKVGGLATEIYQTQIKEIQEMKELLI